MRDNGGTSARRERKGAASSWYPYAASVCVFLHVVETVFDRTSSDYGEVKAMRPDETVVKFCKSAMPRVDQGFVHAAGLYTELQTAYHI